MSHGIDVQFYVHRCSAVCVQWLVCVCGNLCNSWCVCVVICHSAVCVPTTFSATVAVSSPLSLPLNQSTVFACVAGPSQRKAQVSKSINIFVWSGHHNWVQTKSELILLVLGSHETDRKSHNLSSLVKTRQPEVPTTSGT